MKIITVFLFFTSATVFGGGCYRPWVSAPKRQAPIGWCAIPEPYIHGNYFAANLPLFFKGNLDTLLSQIYIQGPINKTVYQVGVKWDLVHLGFLGMDGFEYYSEANNKVEMVIKRKAFPDEIYAIFNLGIIENTVMPLPDVVKSIGYPMLSKNCVGLR